MVYLQGKESVDDFYIDRYEVSMAEFDEFVKATGYKTHDEKVGYGIVYNFSYKKIDGVCWKHDIKGNIIKKEEYHLYPVTRVNFYDALAYAKWKRKDLPTLEQWLYAANEGSLHLKYKFSGSNNIRSVAWFDSNSGEIIQKRGTKKPNKLGIYDLSGNVSEMVLSNTDTMLYYVGGSFFDGKDEAELSAIQQGNGLRLVSNNATLLWTKPNHGFRCVKNKTNND